MRAWGKADIAHKMCKLRVGFVPNKRSSTWLLLIVIYFLVHALIRTSLGWTLTPDEQAIMRDAQTFAWLYDGEMPLYAWLQCAVFDAFGQTVLSLTILKNAIMLLLCLSIFTLVERVANPTYALAATVSLLFVPQIAWTSQHGLTSPVLATLFAATTLLSFSRLSEHQSPLRYGVLGAMIGLGAISSAAFLLIPVALIPAALMSNYFRRVILNRWFLLSIFIAVMLAVLPYYHLSSLKPQIVPDLSEIYPLTFDLVMTRAIGMYGALQTMLTFSSLLIVGAAVTVYSGLGRNQPINNETIALRELLLRIFCIGLLMIFAFTFVNGGGWTTQANLQPLLFLAAPALALYLFPAMSTKTHRNAITVAGVIAIAVLVVTPAYYSFGGKAETSNKQASALGYLN